MKWIKYQIVQCTIGEEDVLLEKKVGYSEDNLAIAEEEAYNGEYEIVEDDKQEPIPVENQELAEHMADETAHCTPVEQEALNMITVADDGYVDLSGLRKVTYVSVVRVGQTINIEATLQGGRVSTDKINLDENDVPVSGTSDGVDWAMDWSGF